MYKYRIKIVTIDIINSYYIPQIFDNAKCEYVNMNNVKYVEKEDALKVINKHKELINNSVISYEYID